jgi:hypothetical protein
MDALGRSNVVPQQAVSVGRDVLDDLPIDRTFVGLLFVARNDNKRGMQKITPALMAAMQQFGGKAGRLEVAQGGDTMEGETRSALSTSSSGAAFFGLLDRRQLSFAGHETITTVLLRGNE